MYIRDVTKRIQPMYNRDITVMQQLYKRYTTVV